MSDHSFQECDESLHIPPEPLPARWQENMFFVGWDLDNGHGFLVHTKRWPASGFHEAHVAIYVDGTPCSAVIHRPIDYTLPMAEEIPELSALPEIPWARWRLQSHIRGPIGPGPMGFVAYAPTGPVEASLDLVLESNLPPADFTNAFAHLDSASKKAPGTPQSTAQVHYEQGGRWSGELRVGDRRVKSSGLFVRDHTWGERSETNFESGVFWTASCLNEGRIFCNAIGFPGHDGTLGVGIAVTENGAFLTSSVHGEFRPAPGLLSYRESKIRYGFETPAILHARTELHVPKYLPGSGARRFDNNAISRVNIGDCKGMGVMEWASVLSSAQADILDALICSTA